MVGTKFGMGLIGLLAIVFWSILADATILPPNDLYLEDQIDRKDANITEAQFNQIIKRSLDFYRPIARRKHSAKLKAQVSWANSTVNAFAQRVYPFWTVSFYGGLARRPEVTLDGFQLVVCHELGHLFGGYPLRRSFFGRLIWMTIEGEADYFATHSCARELWRSEVEENAKHRSTVDSTARERCDAAWETEADQDLCYRTADAGQSLGNMLSVLANSSTPDFSTPDQNQVRKTNSNHPAAQCRLDTYLGGALCGKPFDPNVIPGKSYAAIFSTMTAKKAEKQAAKYSCHTANQDVEGVRPRCWFSPRFW